MKTLDITLLSVSAALFIIGVHQTYIGGIEFSYSIFMLSLAMLFWYQLRKRNTSAQTPSDKKKKGNKQKKK
ncbi:hypothetical protein [Penaeicola halotolerans]|uniref:hypothetical protein n=1 Tax=Penaeicola halotolerans TaxID=2793196 RepID=UPI001CF849F1|nr:hypothetical protein [Penaeicola halotolerans]